MTKNTIEYIFQPEEMRILRIIEDSDGNVVDQRNAEPNEAAELDESLIEEIVSFAETYHPSLFGNIRELPPREILGLRTILLRMADSVRTYAVYRELQESRQQEQEEGEQEEEINEEEEEVEEEVES